MKRADWKEKKIENDESRHFGPARRMPLFFWGGVVLPLILTGCVTTAGGKKLRPFEALRAADMRFNTWLDSRVGFETESDAARRAAATSALP